MALGPDGLVETLMKAARGHINRAVPENQALTTFQLVQNFYDAMNFYSSINSYCKTSDFLCVNAELAYSTFSIFPWNNLLLLTMLQGSLLSAAIETSVPSENQKADL